MRQGKSSQEASPPASHLLSRCDAFLTLLPGLENGFVTSQITCLCWTHQHKIGGGREQSKHHYTYTFVSPRPPQHSVKWQLSNNQSCNHSTMQQSCDIFSECRQLSLHQSSIDKRGMSAYCNVDPHTWIGDRRLATIIPWNLLCGDFCAARCVKKIFYPRMKFCKMHEKGPKSRSEDLRSPNALYEQLRIFTVNENHFLFKFQKFEKANTF
jgi:hypothetical protein